jgi:hypothetical protein
MTTALGEFFESLRAEADLAKMVAEGVQEDLHLELKTKKNSSLPDIDDSDRWQFSRALSGFANSDGGILLFGIETGPQERARALKPITNPEEFQPRLKKSLINTTQPVVPGVRIEVIPASGGGQGFVKVLVPASESTPHRAMLADREYYKRSTEGFYRLEHFDISDLFGRRPAPGLELVHQLLTGGVGSSSAGKEFGGSVVIGLRNVGRSVVHYAYLTLRVTAPYKLASWGLDGNGHEGLPRLASIDGNHRRFGAGADLVIHPGVTHDVTKIDVDIRVDNDGQVGAVSDLSFICEWACDGLPLREQEVTFPAAELIERIVPTGERSAQHPLAADGGA